MILTTAVLFCLPGAPSAPGCLAASGRQARLRQAAAGAPASLRRTRWRGFGPGADTATTCRTDCPG
ncbi:hypothetical protein [Escherichia coli]|uniref:hypothetical protein n=1 Tax=Escherichia coli TaxID=562 RepID=UPI0020230E33|nr:hypothetical protein [Escherichia coli]